jgi:hypothetical protein
VADKLLYEVHELTPGRFVWHVFEPDGVTLHDWWSADATVEEVDGVPTVVNEGPTFRTEEQAAAYVEKTYKAKCKTRFTS